MVAAAMPAVARRNDRRLCCLLFMSFFPCA
jgi:hypothetical protein